MEKNNTYKQNFRIVNLTGYEKPKANESYAHKWIEWGEDNGYFDRLIDLNLGSPTNSRCIKGISDMIYGRGVDALDSVEKRDEFAEMKLIFKDEDVSRVVNDRKELGMAALQITYNKTKTRILSATHFPMETLRAEKASKGVIKAWYYHPDWSEYKSSDQPKRIPSFGNGSNKQINEILVIKPYQAGYYYYTPADYHGCLQYANLEEEVSNYHISNIKNGLQPSLFVNFNNGIPPEETQELLERKINEKFGGSSNAGKAIISFNEDKESASTIEAIHLPDAHAQYQFLADESREKIMLGHGIVSPILLGIKDNTGFGNNAEELRTASIIMDNIVIRPFQQEIIRAMDSVLSFNNIYLKLYFVTLQPIEFTELDNVTTKIRKEEETGEKLSSDELCDFTEEEGNDMLSQMDDLGEVISDEWELVHSQVADNEEVDIENLKQHFKSDKPSLLEKFASIIKPSKNSKSNQDTDIYKVRYAYMPSRKSLNSRSFCQHMELFTDNDVVFRKEDINMMSFRGVNKVLGHNKQNYSLFKFKGGKNCKHYWEMRVYKKKGGGRVSSNKVDVKNPSEITKRPYDMPNRGAYPNK